MLLAAILSAWLQYGSDGQPHARAVTEHACPILSIDGRPRVMSQRSAPSAAFPDSVCDAPVPISAQRIRVDDRALPAPVTHLHSIVVLGDTGCRIKGVLIQGCNDPVAWPFPTIARSIARVHPDLIVHVGDYLYRESACPPLLPQCAGSPSGDTESAWEADWFTPAAPFFSSAPLVLLRGNHEDCDRAGTGWFRYLDPHPETACVALSAPFAVDLPGLRLIGFDSAGGSDQSTDPALVAMYAERFAAARALASGPSWFITHRPPYLNANERAAMGKDLAPFSAILAGHIHLFSAVNIQGLPPLIVNGEGGDRLDTEIAPFLTLGLGSLRERNPPFTESHFGFGVYTRTPQGWSISLRDPQGNETAVCTLENNALTCMHRS